LLFQIRCDLVFDSFPGKKKAADYRHIQVRSVEDSFDQAKESARRICGPIIYPHNNCSKIVP